MVHYLVEFVHYHEYDHNFVQHVESNEGEIEDKVKSIYKDVLKKHIKYELEENDNSMSEEELDSIINSNITANVQGFDFPKDFDSRDELDEMIGVTPESTIRYIELTDKHMEKLKPMMTETCRLKNGYALRYDSGNQRWDINIIPILGEVGYGTAEEIFKKIKSINHAFEDYELEDWRNWIE